MSLRSVRRLFHSAFTKLLVIILIAGVAITLTLVIGFSVLRFHSISHLDRNLLLYAEYLTQDMGDPPDYRRAEEIAERTGMAIRFDHPNRPWHTPTFPASMSFDHGWIRQHHTGIRTGHTRGRMFIRLPHGGGELIFVSPHAAKDHENAGWILLIMATALSGFLAAAYFLIRRVLGPLRTLKTGVEALGAGKLDHRVPGKGHDEFQDLAEAFNTMAKRLSDLLNTKEQLLLDVSHELRSPLTRLKVQLEFLEDEETRKALGAEVTEMENMVSAILEQAKLRNTAASLALERIDLAALARSVAADFSNGLPKVVCGDLPRVHVPGDREKMKMVLRNLLDNAVKNTPDDGEPVMISVDRSDDEAVIAVEDKGIGIPGKALPHLFEPFYRTDASRSRKTGGYGLGLSLCKAIVDAHRGCIDISSEVKRGTRVVVTLPVA
jgi:signal transduction histidine kinase